MTLTCLDCKKKGFTTLYAMQYHADEEHHWCPFCKAGFPQREEVLIHHKVQPHHCMFCYRCFKTQAGLDDHLKSYKVHLELNTEQYVDRLNRLNHNRWFICGICEEQYQQLHQLQHHRTVHHGKSLVPATSEPSSIAISASALVQNTSADAVGKGKRHTNPQYAANTFQQPLMAIDTTSEQAQLPVNTSTELATTTVPPRTFFCSPCNDTLPTFPDLVKHLLRSSVHESGPDVVEAQGLACQTCSKRFSLPQEFEAHLAKKSKHMRSQNPPGQPTIATAIPPPSKLLPSRKQRKSKPGRLQVVVDALAPLQTGSPSLHGDQTSPRVTIGIPIVGVTQTLDHVALTVVRGRQPAPATILAPSSDRADSPRPDVVEDNIEDCVVHCRQCQMEFSCVEALIDHYHDEMHRGHEIWCYTCDQAFAKPHLLWPHLLRSERHDNAPSGSRFEFSSAEYRVNALLQGLRSSGEAPLDIDGRNLKARKRRLKLTKTSQSEKKIKLGS